MKKTILMLLCTCQMLRPSQVSQDVSVQKGRGWTELSQEELVAEAKFLQCLPYASLDAKFRELQNLLLHYPRFVDAKDISGRTPLIHAARFRNAKAVSLLIQSEAHVDEKDDTYGFTALMESAWVGQVECIILLLEAQASQYIRSHDGCTFATILKKRHPLLFKDPKIKKALGKKD